MLCQRPKAKQGTSMLCQRPKAKQGTSIAVLDQW